MAKDLKILSHSEDYKARENLYIALRQKEGRLYPDEIVSHLPVIKPEHALSKEWAIRAASLKRVKKYLSGKNKPLEILDLGCGNGWMSNALTSINNSVVTGMDVNMEELKQAARVFKQNGRLQLIYGDIFKDALPGSFDIIICSAAIQYFPSLTDLTTHLLSLLKIGGEIHFTDSPIYYKKKLLNARERSRIYYAEKGFKEMTMFYHHHTWDELSSFEYMVMGKPFLKHLLAKISGNPYFPWIMIRK